MDASSWSMTPFWLKCRFFWIVVGLWQQYKFTVDASLFIYIYGCCSDPLLLWQSNIYKRYGKKIWFTEFALPSTMNQQDEMEYMQVNDMNTMKRFKLSSLSRPSCHTWSRVRPSGGTPGSCTGGRWTDLVRDGILTESSLSWRTSRRHWQSWEDTTTTSSIACQHWNIINKSCIFLDACIILPLILIIKDKGRCNEHFGRWTSIYSDTGSPPGENCS